MPLDHSLFHAHGSSGELRRELEAGGFDVRAHRDGLSAVLVLEMRKRHVGANGETVGVTFELADVELCMAASPGQLLDSALLKMRRHLESEIERVERATFPSLRLTSPKPKATAQARSRRRIRFD